MLAFIRHGLLALAIVPLLSLGGGCSNGSDSSTDFGNNDPSLVVALGDSITFGYGDSYVYSCSESYRGTIGFCPRLAGLTGKTVINEGRCGETSGEGLDRINDVLQRWRPGVVLLDYSPNDILNGTEEVIRNLRGMIAAARANKTVPVLGTLVPAVGEHAGWEGFIVPLNAQILALCEEEGLQCADHHTAFVTDPGFIASPYTLLTLDGEHPNGAGYELMAETWRKPLLRVY
jgi:lysophospholipase L1-like esterase